MTRARKSDRLVARLVKLVGLSVAATASSIALRQVPSLWRYLQMKRIAKKRDGSKPAPNYDAPEYAQGPRMAGERDANRSHRRREPKKDTEQKTL